MAGLATIELPGEAIRMVGPAIGVAEDETPIVVGGPDLQSFLSLACPPRA